MMTTHKYPHKDRQVKIYRSKTVKWRNEFDEGTYQEKHYIHDRKKFLNAYIQQVTSNITQTPDVDLITDRFLVVVNGRKSLMPIGQYYVEWKDSYGYRHVFKVLTKDLLDMRGFEIKLTCQEISADTSVYKRVSDEGVQE